MGNFKKIIFEYDALPRDIQKALSQETKDSIQKVSQKIVHFLPESYMHVPKDFLNAIDRDKVVKGLSKAIRRDPRAVGDILTEEEMANLNSEQVAKEINTHLRGLLKYERHFPQLDWEALPDFFKQFVSNEHKFSYAQKILKAFQDGHTLYGPYMPKQLIPFTDMGALAKLWDKEILTKPYILYRQENPIQPEIVPYLNWAALQAVVKKELRQTGDVKSFTNIPQHIRKYIPEAEIAKVLKEILLLEGKESLYMLPHRDKETLDFLKPYITKEEIYAIHRQNVAEDPRKMLTNDPFYQQMGVNPLPNEERIQMWDNYIKANTPITMTRQFTILASVPYGTWQKLPEDTKIRLATAFQQNPYHVGVTVPFYINNYIERLPKIPTSDLGLLKLPGYKPIPPRSTDLPREASSKNWYQLNTKLAQRTNKMKYLHFLMPPKGK